MNNELVTRGLYVKAVRTASREADFIASTDAVDSYDEIVAQNWDLGRYKSNPVVLYAHDSRELPIGRATRCEMVNGSLECTVQFASAKANPRAEEVWTCVQEKVLNAVSVGFSPREVRSEKRDGKDVYVLDDNELYEISVVPIPANAEALSKMKRRALEQRVTENPTMDIKVLQERAETAEKRVESLEIEHKALVTAHETQSAELDSVKAAHAADLEKFKTLADEKAAAVDALLVREVDALVGAKFTAAERDDQLELARSNKSMFDKLAASRPDLKILGASVITKEPDPNMNTATEPLNGDSFAAEAKALAAKNPEALAESTPWG